MKTRRWLKVECSPSDTPPILLPRHLPPSLSFAANSLRSHMPLCDSMAGTGLPADVRRCSEWICFPPPASCFSQTHPLPSPSFEGRDRVWRNAGDNVRWAWGVPARSVLHLQKDRCLEGAGKAALELDAACPSLTGFQFHVYSNASCGSQFQSRADFSALTKSSEDFETAEALRLALPRAPSTRISHLKLPRVPSTQNPHLKLPYTPSTKIFHLKLPRALHLESHIRNRLTPLNQESLTCRLNLLCFIEISFPLVLK